MAKTRVIAIIGTDIAGPQPWWDAPWMVKPWLDNGNLQFDRSHEPSMKRQHYELAVLARVHCIAIGFRTIHDAGWPHIPLLIKVAREANAPLPFFCPWIDTGSLSDLTGPDPFDFGNDAHIVKAWNEFIGPIYDVIPADLWELTKNGRKLMLYWGVHPKMGHGMVNLDKTQRLLDYVAAQSVAQGHGEPDAIVADTWGTVNVFGMHSWFDPGIGKSYTVKEHNGVKVGVMVPGFHDPPDAPLPHRVIPRRNGQTFQDAFTTFDLMDVDYGIWESYNNMIESAGGYCCEPNQVDPTNGQVKSWQPDTLYLDIVNKFVESIDGPLPSIPKGASMIAVSPVKDYVLYEDLVPGAFQDTFAMIIGVATEADKDVPGYAPGRKKIFSLDDLGTEGWRWLDGEGQPGPWESGVKLRNGQVLKFRTDNHVRMFWIIEGI